MLKRGGKRIDYDYFDFHYHYKRGNGTATLDAYVNEQLKNLYLTNIGIYTEKASFTYTADGENL